jgi:hypothetical protein
MAREIAATRQVEPFPGRRARLAVRGLVVLAVISTAFPVAWRTGLFIWILPGVVALWDG